ncbi:MAG: hypothetical protein HKN20_15555 [Gemmatimonadetes bacterium]|nr:hypothetical protein [Gemmatimonadota bacterium]
MKLAILLALAAGLAYCAYGLMNTLEAGETGAAVWKMRGIYAAGAVLCVAGLVRTTVALFKQIILLVVLGAAAYYWFFVR